MNKYCKITSSITILRMALFALLLPSHHVFAEPQIKLVDLIKGVASLAKANNQQPKTNNQQTANSDRAGTSGSALTTTHSIENQQIDEAQAIELARQAVLVEAFLEDYAKTHPTKDGTLAAALRAAAKIENIDSAETAAMVNGVPVPQARINLRVKAAVAQGQTDSPELRKAIKEYTISYELASQEAIKKGLDKQPETARKLELAKQTPLPASAVQNQPTASVVSRVKCRI